LNRALQSVFSIFPAPARIRISAWRLRNFSTARPQEVTDEMASRAEKDSGGEAGMLWGIEEWGDEEEIAPTDVEMTGCGGKAEIGGSSGFSLASRLKTNPCSVSRQTKQSKLSCLKPATIPASLGFTAVKIISPPHAMQRIMPTLTTWSPQQNAGLRPKDRSNVSETHRYVKIGGQYRQLCDRRRLVHRLSTDTGSQCDSERTH
jgi:hypothetical protein